MDDDEGDYATLRELPIPPTSPQRISSGEDTASEEGKVSINVLYFQPTKFNFDYRLQKYFC